MAKVYLGKCKTTTRETQYGVKTDVSGYIEQEALLKLSLYKGKKYIFKITDLKEPDKFGYNKTIWADPYFHPECADEGQKTYLNKGVTNEPQKPAGSDW